MVKIKLAATILLARDHQGILEVLLLKRNKALAFAAGLWVFPGGKIEPAEIEQTEDELAAAKMAAVRETKEEADLNISSNDLIFFSHWTTPKVEPRRFATYFFFAGVSTKTSEVTIDDSEIKQHLWINPQAALDQINIGELAMLPPTIMSLQLIRKCKTIEEIKELLKEKEPIYTLPVLKTMGPKMVCLFEGDAGHALADLDLDGPRHRFTLDIEKGTYDFEFKGCDGITPVNGGIHL